MEQYWQLIVIPAIGYLFIQNNQQSKMISVLRTQMDIMINKMDVFLKTETDVLKDTLRENTQALKDIKNNR
jgi:3D (Asp-Asp-Asp) domain-containing protein